MDPGSSVLLLNKFRASTDARARAAEIPGIDPGSNVLLIPEIEMKEVFEKNDMDMYMPIKAIKVIELHVDGNGNRIGKSNLR